MSLVKQQGQYDSLLACIAMLLGRPYAELWPQNYFEQIENGRGYFIGRIDSVFDLVKLTREIDYWMTAPPGRVTGDDHALRVLLNGRRAILRVPSLDYEKRAHHVYWDGHMLHDPSNGRTYMWLESCIIQLIWVFNETRGR